MVQVLADNDVKLDARDINGQTAIFHASISGHYKSIELLVNLGADINIPNSSGITPVKKAIANKDAKMEAFLRKLGGRE